jgi:prepilin-type N-terminal cleavage/methylation domain-containing protein
MPRLNNKTRQKGLNLIEVAISLAIFAVIIVSILNIFSQGYRYLRKNRMDFIACFLAQEKMEGLLNASYVFSNPANMSKAAVSNFTDFQIGVNFTSPPQGFSSPYYDNLAQINVTVYWQGQTGEQNFTLATYLANVSE